MPRALINGISMHYQQVGRGPDLVLVHGLFGNLAFWYLSVVAALGERFRVTVYDLRGHGLTDETVNGYRSVDLAADLAALLKCLEIDSAHLVGHSFGGAVALALAIHHKDSCKSLTLADAWVPTFQPSQTLRDARAWRQLQRRLRNVGLQVPRDMPMVTHAFFEELLEVHSRQDDRSILRHNLNNSICLNDTSLALQRWRRLVRKTEIINEISDCTGISISDIRTIHSQSFLLFGVRSRFLPTLEGLRSCLPDARTIILPNAGHFFPMVRPQAFIRLMFRLGDVLASGIQKGQISAQRHRLRVASDFL